VPLPWRNRAKLNDHPLVGNVRNSGLMAGVELVADKASKRSFDPKATVGAKAVKFMQDHGLILRAIGDTISLCPPMIITQEEINMMFDALELALDDAEHMVSKEGMRSA